MADRAEAGGGFTVLDGVALVTGAAVASVHIRSAVPEFDGPVDWAWAWCLFIWLSLTSAGPFVFLVRRFFTRPSGYPRLGDRLWAMAGLPWLLAAMVRTGEPPAEAVAGRARPGLRRLPEHRPGLSGRWWPCPCSRPGICWSTPLDRRSPSRSTWTHRLGLFLTVAWPIQCGVGLVVMG